MKVKIGTVKEDVTAFGNRFWIQIEDSSKNDNSDLKELVGKRVPVSVGTIEITVDVTDSYPYLDGEI